MTPLDPPAGSARFRTIPATTGVQWAALLVVAFAIAALPYALVETPPLFDLPNHLARVDAILRHGADPALRDAYRLDGFAIPNVLSDLVLLLLIGLEGPDAAGRHLLLLTAALTFAGIALLTRVASGRWSPFALLAGVFLTNEMVVWGFLNYNLGLGLLPFALATWMALRHAGRRAHWLFAATAFALLLFFAHLVVFALFAVAVALLEAMRALRDRRRGLARTAGSLALSALPFLPALAVWAAASSANRLPFDPRFDYSLWGKLSPFARLLASGTPALDSLLLGGVVLFAVYALALGRARLHAGLGVIALVYAGLVLVLPYSMLGSYFLDARIAVAAVLLAVAALVPARPGIGENGVEIAILLVLLAIRTAGLVGDWQRQDAEIADVRAAFRAIPEGSIVIAASARPFELGDWQQTRRTAPAHEHTIAYAALDRHALVPTLFARAGQNPLVWQPASAALRALDRNPLPRLFRPADFGAFVAPAAAVAAEEAAPGGAGRAVYAVAFFATCSDWPADLPVTPVVCERGFSIQRVAARRPAAIGAAR